MIWAEWHHWCNRYEIGQTLGDGEGQGILECCCPCGHKEVDMTGRLNNEQKCAIGDIERNNLNQSLLC